MTDRQVIHSDHLHCAVCGAVTETTVYDDGTMDYRVEPHDYPLHVAVVQRAQAARWN